jgi:hypothetical protein
LNPLQNKGFFFGEQPSAGKRNPAERVRRAALKDSSPSKRMPRGHV